jgi:hypothetical protein
MNDERVRVSFLKQYIFQATHDSVPVGPCNDGSHVTMPKLLRQSKLKGKMENQECIWKHQMAGIGGKQEQKLQKPNLKLSLIPRRF